MKHHILYPLLSLFLGGLGAVLYLWQRSGYQDGLPADGHPASLALLALSALACILFLFLTIRGREFRPGAFYTGSYPARASLLLACAALLLLSSMYYLRNVLDALTVGTMYLSSLPELARVVLSVLTSSLLECILIIISIPTSVSIIFLAKDTKEGRGSSHNSLMVVMPVLYCWVWLIDAYRRYTGNPVLWDYVFLLLTIIALLLSAQCRASFSFSDGKPRLALFSSLCALFLVPISLFGDYGLASMFTTMAMALYTLSTLIGLLRDVPIPSPPPSEIPSEVSVDES